MKDNVDAAHVLSLERAEIVTAAVSESGVRVLILDYVAYIQNAVRAAPVAELERESLAPEPCHRVHVREAHLRREAFHREPERR